MRVDRSEPRNLSSDICLHLYVNMYNVFMSAYMYTYVKYICMHICTYVSSYVYARTVRSELRKVFNHICIFNIDI